MALTPNSPNAWKEMQGIDEMDSRFEYLVAAAAEEVVSGIKDMVSLGVVSG